MINQYSVYWGDFNPTRGAEINKIRPCVVITPNDLNNNLKTVLVCPMTNTFRDVPFRVAITLNSITGYAMIDQIRTFDKSRLDNHIGDLDEETITILKQAIKEVLID